MDLYGRPQAPRRSSPNVVFLNDRSRSQSFSSQFAAPTGRPDSKIEEEQQLRVNGENFASGVNSSSNNNSKAVSSQNAIAPSNQLNQHSRPPTVRMNRPQSGGTWRPEPTDSSALMKQRPRTAREGARTLSPGVRYPEDPREMFIKRTVCFQEPNPETDDANSDNREEDEDALASSRTSSLSPSSSSTMDERYIRQLKDDILYLSQLNLEKSNNSASKTPQRIVPHNHHIKNMHSIRENKLGFSAAGDHASECPESIQTQLLRYNYSLDPVQVVVAKAKLETILSDELTKLMKLFIAVGKEGDEGATNHDLQKNDRDSVELKRPPGSAEKKLLPYGNGCSARSPASVFTGAFLGVLHQTEILKKKMLAASAEKVGLAETVAEKEKQLVQLSEDIVFFKDALAKGKGSSIGWARLQSNWRKAVALAKQNREPQDESTATAASSSERASLEGEKVEDHSAKIAKLEREIGALQVSIQAYQDDKEKLSKELAASKIELEGSKGHMSQTLEQMKAMALVHSRELDELRNTLGSQLRSSEKALLIATERYKKLEEIAAQEKQQLRLDKQELEGMLRRKDEELQLRAQQVAKEPEKKANSQLKLASEQVEKLRMDLKRSEQRTASLQNQLDTFKADAALLNSTITTLKTESATSVLHLREKELCLTKADSSILEKEAALQHTQSRLDASLEDLKWHKQQLLHQENQLQLLEVKLSRSIPVDDEEAQRRKQADESNWNQRLAALEHALASEKQNALSLKAQQRTSIGIERERAEHAVAQFKAVAEELEVANLCLAERKKQREQESTAFEDEKQALQHRIAALDAELRSLRFQHQQESRKPEEDQETRKLLEMEIQRLSDQLRAAKQEVDSVRSEAQQHGEQFIQQHELAQRECEASWQLKMEQEVAKYRSAANLAETAELEVRNALEALCEERDFLAQKVQTLERATPRNSNSALSETRVELQKAKQKIALLEDKLARNDTSRAKDIDGKLALLSARDRKSTEEQILLKKQRNELGAERKELQTAKHAFEQEKAVHAAAVARLLDEKRLIKQVILVLVQRLKMQLALLSIIPSEVRATAKEKEAKSSSHRDLNGSTLNEFLHKFQQQHVDKWRNMHSRWEQLQQDLDDADWQLVHMKHRLEELSLDDQLMNPKHPTGTPKSHGGGGLNTTSPFSDAVAAGKDTVPVAEQLKASSSSRSIASSGAQAPHLDATDKVSLASALAKVEEQETFALALAKEMKAMKDSYEAKIEDLQHELRTAQRLRMESSQRLRAELDDERKRNQHVIAQLTEKCVALEARLAALQKRFATLQDQEIELLERHADASDETFRRETLHALFVLISESCRDEMDQRRTQRTERMNKLHAYCGSSSVTVERDDKKQLQ